jgi:hypothetical protein
VPRFVPTTGFYAVFWTVTRYGWRPWKWQKVQLGSTRCKSKLPGKRWFGTRGSEVQILSPRPLNSTESLDYRRRQFRKIRNLGPIGSN